MSEFVPHEERRCGLCGHHQNWHRESDESCMPCWFDSAQIGKHAFLPPVPWVARPDVARPADGITAACDALKALLLAKNAGYGNSALDPVRIVSQAAAVEQLKVRVDDKLSRLKRGHLKTKAELQEIYGDLAGYFVLLGIAVELSHEA